MEQISKLVFISNQKLLILSTYSVIATILLINSALYIIPVILIIMGNCFWFYFVLLGASFRRRVQYHQYFTSPLIPRTALIVILSGGPQLAQGRNWSRAREVT